MTLVLTILFGVLFFLAIMASVALHEIGHMLPAKLFGVKVPKYFVGFGRTLWSIKRGETEYGLKLIPLGGFVQLLGMYPPRRPDAPDTRLQRLADEAREAEWDDIDPADQTAHRLFYQQKTWQKLVMMVGGITMNLVLSFVLLWGVVGLHGVAQYLPTVGGIQQCVIVPARTEKTCLPTDPQTPAAKAGLAKGDTIVEFNGVPVTSHEQLTAMLRGNGDGEARLVVLRAGERVNLPIVHTLLNTVTDPADPSKTVQVGYLGFYPTVGIVKGGPVEVLAQMREMTVQALGILVQMPVRVFNVWADVAQQKPRDPNGPISVVGASTVAGEIATTDELSVGDKVATYAGLLASLNLFLAIFNVVPLPPLDGGHIVGALYEGGRRMLARLRGKPDPGPADTARLLPIAYAVGALLLIMGVALIIADVVSPVKIF